MGSCRVGSLGSALGFSYEGQVGCGVDFVSHMEEVRIWETQAALMTMILRSDIVGECRV